MFLFSKICLCLLLLLPSIAAAQNAPVWSAAQSVAADSFGFYNPRIALLPDGSPLIAWAKTDFVSPASIWVTKRENGAFLTPVSVPTGGISPSIYEFGGMDLAVWNNRVFVVFEKSNIGIFLVRSDDAGATFLPPIKIFADTLGQRSILPTLKTDALGNPMVSFICTTPNSPAKYLFMRSTDGGATFLPPVTANESLSGGGAVCECCLSDMAVTGDSVWLAFRANRNNIRDIWVARSTDGGSTFDVVTDVDNTDWQINACPVSGPRILKTAENLSTVWMSKGLGNVRVYANALDAATMDAAEPIQLALPDATGDGQNRPSIAGSGQTIGMVWESSDIAGTQQDIVFAFSDNGLAGLANAVAVPIAAEAGNQLFPQLVYGTDAFHVVYVDFHTQTVKYQRGTLTTSATSIAKSKSNCPICFDILPLPTDVDGSKIAFAEIYDLAGRVIHTFRTNDFGRQFFDVSGLPIGFYWLKINDRKGRSMTVQRFFKNK